MPGSEVQLIARVMEQNQEETRQQFGELRESTSKVAEAVAELTTTIAKVEERHARHDDGLKRMGKVVDDHETRIRTLEGNKQAVKGGWKVIAALLGGVVTVASLTFGFISSFGG